MITDPAVIRAQRLALIIRAVKHLDTTPRGELVAQLTAPHICLHEHLRHDPATLAEHLRAVNADSDAARLFGAYKAAQNVLLAANLPYMTDDYAAPATPGQESEDR